ncbi:MAG: hypothetical protein Q7J04_05115 [Microcella sp.]|nr:hypothetical protein [Microcella sp.]
MTPIRFRSLVLASLLPVVAILATGGAAAATTVDDSSSSRTSSEPTSEPSTPLVFTPAAAGTASYYPMGPQTNVALADLAGWELCYTDLYGTADVDLYGSGGILDELCTGDFLLLGGGPVATGTLTVLAAAPRTDVLFVLPPDETTVHVANGSGWYFNDDWSWGFVRAGDTPEKSECDVSTDGSNDQKLCWHVFNQQLTYGYRAGAQQGLNDSEDYARYIYHAAAIEGLAPDPELTDPELADTGVTVDASAAAGAAALVLLMGVGGLALAYRRRAVR